MSRSKDLTSGQVSDILGIARRTACKLADSGKIESYRLPTDSNKHLGDRRCSPRSLLKFIIENDMLTSDTIVTKMREVVGDQYDGMAKSLTEEIKDHRRRNRC